VATSGGVAKKLKGNIKCGISILTRATTMINLISLIEETNSDIGIESVDVIASIERYVSAACVRMYAREDP
jgi:hypothetical protein